MLLRVKVQMYEDKKDDIKFFSESPLLKHNLWSLY